jgi:hypothetical protein
MDIRFIAAYVVLVLVAWRLCGGLWRASCIRPAQSVCVVLAEELENWKHSVLIVTE